MYLLLLYIILTGYAIYKAYTWGKEDGYLNGKLDGLLEAKGLVKDLMIESLKRELEKKDE
jgi:hypothetical protein